jgi:hypothetical protein
MKKTNILLTVMTVVLVLLISACGGAPAPAEPAAQQPAVEQPQVVESQPTQPPAEAPAQSFAPACQTTSSSCSAPALTDTVPNNTYCVKKVPYQNIMAPAGSVFEPLPKEGDPEFYPLICDDSGTDVDGLRVYSCRGAELWTYDLRITPAGCGATLQTGTGQCAEGQGFDAAQNCCAPVTGNSGGAVTIKVNMGGCPIK